MLLKGIVLFGDVVSDDVGVFVDDDIGAVDASIFAPTVVDIVADGVADAVADADNDADADFDVDASDDDDDDADSGVSPSAIFIFGGFGDKPKRFSSVLLVGFTVVQMV